MKLIKIKNDYIIVNDILADLIKKQFKKQRIKHLKLD